MDDRNYTNQRINSTCEVFESVLSYIHDSRDRQSISLVCRRLYEVEARTRKHVTIAFCYTTTPKQLLQRFPFVESLKLKGKPRAAMYDLIPEDWGGFATPWGGDIQVLKLDKCSGFSTDGLLHICSSCRNIKVLFLEESQVIEKDGNWLHELAMNNTQLETLNFYMTDLSQVSFNDLELIAKRCKSLVSVKIGDSEILDLVGFFRYAVSLEEFSGGCFNKQSEEYASLAFPAQLCRLGLNYISKNEMHIVYPFTSRLKKLDLLYALLDTEDHCVLLQRCPNLEVLETRNVIGDRGLEVLARSCKKMKRLRIERGADEQEMEDEDGVVSQRGLTAIAQGCLELECVAVYVSDITNAALESMGKNLKKLSDFRLVLLEKEEVITDLPLDNGIRSLLSGCNKLRRFALYLRPGGLTDMGLTYIGQHSQNIRWMLLGYLGESDSGLLGFSRGCPSLQKLEVRGCCFSENALAMAVLQLKSLRYLWVQGYIGSETGLDLLAMARPYWNIELIPPRKVQYGEGREIEHPAHILAYYSLAGPRTDFPPSVIPLGSVDQ
ncbi:putative leucine-rich repeat domain superfamily, transport inhibitor response 1 [Helianthus annuus]|nr:putative leucine-rich repeat domain superfamily, transport inhibitor response 1 [Helianthus annuus]